MITTCIFDAYGTLFDVAAAAREAAAKPGGEMLKACWSALAADWRAKQLEYSWQRAITGDHKDFWAVTEDGLDWAMEARGLAPDPDLRAELLGLYRQLSAYEEVPAMLKALKARGLTTGILSNGSPEMLKSAVKSAGIGDALDDVLSVEAVGIFKPANAVYQMVMDRFGGERSDVLFVSSNGWDAAGAARFGFTTVWVNRASTPMDRLGHPPTHVLADLTALPDLIVTA
ncbi:MAG: haloacid dehalogenase type II [Maritimibacter sp.]